MNPCGFLNVNKPADCTSRDIVNRVQRILGRKIKVGHAGTLDPMATGVLVVAVGRATKLISIAHEFSKAYTADFRLGQTSDTDDRTGQVQQVAVAQFPNREQVVAALDQQVGLIQQTPPQFSAIRVQGERAYNQARAGKQVPLKPRPITVHKIDLLAFDYPTLSTFIECGSGTYIRSIARDLGQSLKTGGLMTDLRRDFVGPFHIDQALSSEQLDEYDAEQLQRHIVPVEDLFQDGCQKLTLNQEQVVKLRDGKRLSIATEHERLIAMTDQNKFAAILEREAGDQFVAIINWVPLWFQRDPKQP